MSRNHFKLPLDGKIPKGYRHRHVLLLATGRQEIDVSGRRGAFYRQTGDVQKSEGGLVMDWLAATITRIRFEIGDF